MCVVQDVPKLEFGEKEKVEEKGELASWGGGVRREGGAGNKQRTCTRSPGLSVVQRRLSCIGGA